VISQLPLTAAGGTVAVTSSLPLRAGERPLLAVSESASASAPEQDNNDVTRSGQQHLLMK